MLPRELEYGFHWGQRQHKAVSAIGHKFEHGSPNSRTGGPKFGGCPA